MKKSFAVSLHLLLISVFLCLAPLTTAHAAAGTWSDGENMIYTRWAQTTVGLPDGKVMVVGGCANPSCTSYLSTYEIYDPQLKTWTAHELTIGGGLPYRFGGLDAVVFANQDILIAGVDNAGSSLLYHPQTATWSKAGSLNTPRYHNEYVPLQAFFAITRFGDNGALITGGKSVNTVLKSVERYNSATNIWTAVSDMIQARWRHNAVTLPDGKILVAGGWDQGGNALLTAELYDPTLDQWTQTGNLVHTYAHETTAVVLNNGRVLLAGLDGAELYDPEQGTWTDAGFWTGTKPGVVLLPNGKVLFIGGAASNSAKFSGGIIYDPIAQTTSPVLNMSQGRYWPSAVLLPIDNSVLVAGGYGSVQAFKSVEIYDTGIPVDRRVFLPITIH